MNRGALRAEALRWLKAKAQSARISPETVNTLINLTVKDCYKQKKLRWSELTANPQLVSAGTATANLPERFIRYNAVRWRTGTADTSAPLDPLLKTVWDRRYSARDDQGKIDLTGTPEHYTIYGETVLLGPRPDADGYIMADYDAFPGDIPDGVPYDEEEPELMRDHWPVVLFGTLVNSSLYVVEDSRAPMWESKYKAALAALNAEHAVARTSGGRIYTQEPG